ncbi:hypothetical protein PV726_40830 [Streptomyces europaeiscabiei]|uniref:hypothetical protein n=1 Tax=Streptomyces europaeiscabiei TaxID=146819 RepID=UPI0029BC34BB|nr:hypothetical protein [Streptomyces europaeiscabiei]MDX3696521.1 hypothetical protein [Streptomyces europaeiscabiei]
MAYSPAGERRGRRPGRRLIGTGACADRIEEYEAAHRQVPEQLTVVIRAAA